MMINKQTKKYILIILIMNLFFATSAFSISIKDTTNISSKLINIFLDVDKDDLDIIYVKRKLKGVNFLNEPTRSDIHLIITTRKTGSSGKEYSLNFIGKNDFANSNILLRVNTYANEPENKISESLLESIQIGILPYLSQKEPSLDVDINIIDMNEANLAVNQVDKWNYWVIKLDLKGDIEKEQEQQEVSTNFSLSADRITELWKIKNKIKYKFNELIVNDDDEILISNESFSEIKGEAIRSLSSRFSVGGFASVIQNTSRNLFTAVSIYPAVEYNIFPWDESYKRVFTLGYYAGYKYFKYYTTTIYDKKTEVLPFQSVKLNFEMKEDWGEIQTSFSWNSYFTDMSKYRLSVETDLSLRVNKWLSFLFELEANSVHDQIYLANEETLLEDILLKRKELATNYEFMSAIGIRIYIGSIFNNVVNQRL